VNKISVVLATALAVAAAGCGSSSSGATKNTSSAAGAAGALSAEAQSAATGDIPDNQVFLVLDNARYSMKYPEGWTIKGSGSDRLTISDKNNLVRVLIAPGPAPSPSSVASALSALRASNPTLTFTAPHPFALPASAQAVKAVYTTESAPNAVTGKRVKLIVDRYVVPGPGGRVATVDLGTPAGVDNVDAYRMMIHSFTWR
jgi:hypothetical protein